MLTVDLNSADGVAILHPAEPLTTEDFSNAARVIDEYIRLKGDLQGLIIHTRNFPGWESFSALIKHLVFIRDHHRHIKKIAVITNSPVGGIAEHIVGHFVSAEVRRFDFQDVEGADAWLNNEGGS